MQHRLSIREPYIPDMSDRKPFVLRLNPEKLKALEKWAADEFRSINGQIEYILDQALRKSGRWKTGSSTTNTNNEEK
jgi:hypothetical protein